MNCKCNYAEPARGYPVRFKAEVGRFEPPLGSPLAPLFRTLGTPEPPPLLLVAFFEKRRGCDVVEV